MSFTSGRLQQVCFQKWNLTHKTVVSFVCLFTGWRRTPHLCLLVILEDGFDLHSDDVVVSVCRITAKLLQALWVQTWENQDHERVCVSVCVCRPTADTHTHTYAWSHPLAYTHTDSFRFKGALGEKVICSQTTKLNNDPDTLPSWRVNSACNTRRHTYSKSLDSTEVSFELA